ncbi:F-box protein At5g07610-like [Spinacia oleracea]|uniref:F-box protein At5g07610-like n=1 Tax=Spinacia oleracea TaxID=3562 RepID=A0A9R0ITR2_SPIOL|nr:F-box protein At5g07610-like [Spinacia oleracea]
MKKTTSKSLLIEAIIGNQDLANEVLLRLPPKSLGKSRCISKQFLSLISNPYFERCYSLLHPPSSSGLFLVPSNTSYFPNEIEYLPLSHQYDHPNAPSVSFLTSQGFKILQSCNGLLLCSRKQHITTTYHVCNPTTRQYVDLPRHPFMKKRYHFGLSLAYDPLTSPNYKVISVQTLDDHQGLCQISIYESKTGLWNLQNKMFVAPKGIDFGHAVYCNGNVHWIKGTKSKGSYFNIDTNCLHSLPELPMKETDHVDHHYIFEYFGHSQGYLHYVVTSPTLRHFEIFEMNKEYSRWFLKFKIDLSALARKFPNMARKFLGGYTLDLSYECDVLSVFRGQDENNQFKVLLSIPGEVICYSQKEKTSWKVCDLKVRAEERRVWYRVYSAFEYYETISTL